MNPRHLALLCAAADPAAGLSLFCFEVPALASDRIMYMPAGVHTITPSQNGKPVQVQVRVDAMAAQDLERQRQRLTAEGRKPYFDFAHKDGEASYWPTEFFWEGASQPGVYCRGEWSSAGKGAIEGKLYRQFSPVFHVNDVKARPARVICFEQASPNMGGLVNKPAFRAIAPLFSKEAAAPAPSRAEVRAINQRLERLLAATQSLLAPR